MMTAKTVIIERVLDMEEKMFLSVRSAAPAPCRNDPDSFRLMRRSQFSPWSEEALESYCHDLESADRQGRNLMTLKYARMDNLIPTLSTHPAIPGIVAAQVGWQKELAGEYPCLMARGRPVEEMGIIVSFEKYLKSELETYSARTLDLLKAVVDRLLEDGKNMSELIYSHMVAELGYDSLMEAEQAARIRCRHKP